MSPHRPAAAVLAALLVVLCWGCGAADEPADPPPPAARRSASPPAADAAGVAPEMPARDSVADVSLALKWMVELDAPTAMAARAGDPDGLYVTERSGRVVRVERGDADFSAVLDISDQTTTDGERGLLGLTFSEAGDLLYVSLTDLDGDSRLDEYRMRGAVADPASRRMLMRVAQPFSNHNGGHVVTGPDGLLYYGLGDGGGSEGDGQDLSTLLGAMLRIDPRPGPNGPYTIPDDNPFADGQDGRPEIWVYGLRNPWRFSFDRETGDLWIADVGEEGAEEINHRPFADAGGTNLGWRAFEGSQRYGEGDAPDAVFPLHEYPHDDRCSITGGYVYRGQQIPGLTGAYLFSDYCDGTIRTLVTDDGAIGEHEFAAQQPKIAAFGQDLDGELYALSQSRPIYRILPAD